MSDNNENVKKREISNIIMKIPRDWHLVSKNPPPLDTKVIVRIVDYDQIRDESDKLVLFVEEEKMAMYSEDENHPGKMYWHICPPWPKYDMSPLTYHDRINEGSVITHWAEIKEEEIQEYEHRFDPQGDYTKLKIEVDKEHEEVVYKALLYASFLLDKTGENAYYDVLYDLVSLLDKNAYIENGELEEYDVGLQEALDIIQQAKDALKDDEEDEEDIDVSAAVKAIISEPPKECIKSTKHLIEHYEGQESGEEVAKRLEEQYDFKFSDLKIKDHMIGLVALTIDKFQKEMLYAVIDGEAYQKVKLFNNTMDQFNAPFYAEIEEEFNKITIKKKNPRLTLEERGKQYE